MQAAASICQEKAHAFVLEASDSPTSRNPRSSLVREEDNPSLVNTFRIARRSQNQFHFARHFNRSPLSPSERQVGVWPVRLFMAAAVRKVKSQSIIKRNACELVARRTSNLRAAS